jgi:hypothetical protein
MATTNYQKPDAEELVGVLGDAARDFAACGSWGMIG